VVYPAWIGGLVGDTLAYFTDMVRTQYETQDILNDLFINPHISVVDHSQPDPVQYFKKFVYNHISHRLYAIYSPDIQYSELYTHFDNNRLPTTFTTTKNINRCENGDDCNWGYKIRPLPVYFGLPPPTLKILFGNDWGKIHTANVFMRYGSPLVSFIRVCELIDDTTPASLPSKIYLFKLKNREIYSTPVEIVNISGEIETVYLYLSVGENGYSYYLFGEDDMIEYENQIREHYDN